MRYRERHGNCAVPSEYINKGLSLGRWVSHQRLKYKSLLSGGPNTLSNKRVHILNTIGFVWAIHNCTSWEQRFEELKAFKMKFNHCNVPQHYDENPELGTWCNNTRISYRNLMKGIKVRG